MFSEGKRLNLDQIDICKAMVKLSVCLTVNDNIKRTNGELSSLLGIPVTLAKKQFMERKQEKWNKDYVRNNDKEGEKTPNKISFGQGLHHGKGMHKERMSQ